MTPGASVPVGYVVKRYPRYSETFIVTEILAHEAAGLPIEIFSLRSPNDHHFQDTIARVRAPVHYLSSETGRASELWAFLRDACHEFPQLRTELQEAVEYEALDVYQAVLVAREVRQRGIHHIHAHFASVATTVARLAARFAGVPYSFTAHAKDIFHESVRADDLRRKLRDAAAVITVSEYNKEYLHQAFGGDSARVQRVYNGLDLERFRYDAPSVRPARIVSVGRLVEKKGFADLIDACAVLASRGGAFTCEIIGTGELEESLKEHARRLGLQARIEFLGARPQEEVIDRVKSAAVFVGPYVVADDGNREGLPTTILEAMALGTPCVSTDVSGLPEVLQDGSTGLMVPQHDPGALAEAIERLLADASLRLRLATRARGLIETQFEIRRNVACLREVFQAAARGGGAVASTVV